MVTHYFEENTSLKVNNKFYFYTTFPPKSAKYCIETLTQQPSADIGLFELNKYFKFVDGKDEKLLT